jgi:hypothetical protein
MNRPKTAVTAGYDYRDLAAWDLELHDSEQAALRAHFKREPLPEPGYWARVRPNAPESGAPIDRRMTADERQAADELDGQGRA